MYNDLPERAEQLDVLADDAPVTTIVKNEIIDGFVNKYRNKKGTFSRNPRHLRTRQRKDSVVIFSSLVERTR